MKHYTSPSITVAGSVRSLTQQGGGTNYVDVQFDTEIDLSNPAGFTGVTPSSPLGS